MGARPVLIAEAAPLVLGRELEINQAIQRLDVAAHDRTSVDVNRRSAADIQRHAIGAIGVNGLFGIRG
jgi:hypothetical protein